MCRGVRDLAHLDPLCFLLTGLCRYVRCVFYVSGCPLSSTFGSFVFFAHRVAHRASHEAQQPEGRAARRHVGKEAS